MSKKSKEPKKDWSLETTPLLLHEAWPLLRQYVRLEWYDRDGGAVDPRKRVELDTLPPFFNPDEVIIPCCHCGKPIHPFRQRREGERVVPGHYYVSVSCVLKGARPDGEEGITGCARGNAAREAYVQIVADVSALYTVQGPKIPDPPAQLELGVAPAPTKAERDASIVLATKDRPISARLLTWDSGPLAGHTVVVTCHERCARVDPDGSQLFGIDVAHAKKLAQDLLLAITRAEAMPITKPIDHRALPTSAPEAR
jgi:hypothetical protein